MARLRANLVFAIFAVGAVSPTFAASGTTAPPIEDVATRLPRNQFVWTDNASAEPVSIVISLLTQRAYVYRGSTMIGATTISSGKDGKSTPLGTYPILQKSAVHKSTLYAGASMPFMQRLTWDGIAIHAGNNPGFPASHGCIRVPTGFAKLLFGVTTLGTSVTVTDDFEGGSEGGGFEGGGAVDAPAADQDTAVANLRQSVALEK